MQITLQEFFNTNKKAGIRCETLEQANLLMETFRKLGKAWCSGRAYDNPNFNSYGSKTVYTNVGTFGPVGFYNDNEPKMKIYDLKEVYFVGNPFFVSDTADYKAKYLEDCGIAKEHNLEKIGDDWWVTTSDGERTLLEVVDILTDAKKIILTTNKDEYVLCSNCGTWHKRTDLVNEELDDGKIYCNECFDDCTFWCDYHERYESKNVNDVFNPSHFNVVTKGGAIVKWCISAADNHAFFSEFNSVYYDTEYFFSVEVINEYGALENWREDQVVGNARYCEHCERYVSNARFRDGSNVCIQCERNMYKRSDLINCYHHSKNGKYKNLKYGKSRFKTWGGLGFELEVDNLNRTYKGQHELIKELICIFGDRLSFERDGSLSEYGFEIVSAPHSKEEFYKVNWTTLLNKCAEYGYTSHDAGCCGLHVHVSSAMFGADIDTQRHNIAKLSLFYSKYYDEFVKLSRRTSSAAGEWAFNHWFDFGRLNINKLIEKAENEIKYPDSRYQALNFTNRMKDDDGDEINHPLTVEFRLNRGTLNPSTFYATIDIILNLVRNSKHISLENVLDKYHIADWFKGCKKETYDYIVSRKAFADVFNAENIVDFPFENESNDPDYGYDDDDDDYE